MDVIKNQKARALFDKVSDLFDSRNLFLSSDFEADDVKIGHSYFIPFNEDIEDVEFEIVLRQKLEYEIKPILYEYIKDGILLDNARGVVDQLDV